ARERRKLLVDELAALEVRAVNAQVRRRRYPPEGNGPCSARIERHRAEACHAKSGQAQDGDGAQSAESLLRQESNAANARSERQWQHWQQEARYAGRSSYAKADDQPDDEHDAPQR